VLLFDLATCVVCGLSDYFLNSDKGRASCDLIFQYLPSMVFLNTKVNELTWARPFMIFNNRRSVEVVSQADLEFFYCLSQGSVVHAN